MAISRRSWGAALLVVALTACGRAGDDRPIVRQVGTWRAGVSAFCTATVNGVGELDVEDDYLPHVVACENGAADDEALRAQAVAARSYLYYKLATAGSVADGTGDQVYTCSNQPSARHYAAVATTSGEVLMYEGTRVAAFYVAGAVPSDRASCVAVGSDNDYSSTEQWVTYNWERSGTGHEQTNLGWVSEGNHANRGCKSQNGAGCLSEAGWPYEDILRFYYGMDIEHVVADGACVTATGLPHGCGELVDGAEAVFDDGGACFIRGCSSSPAWAAKPEGEGGGSLVTGGYAGDEADCFGRWQLSFAAAGEHVVEVHIPDVGARVSEASYLVRHGGQESVVVVDQSAASDEWVELGTFSFEAGSFQYVELGDTAQENGTLADGPYVVFDAVRVRPTGAPGADAGPPPPLPEDAGPEPVDDAGGHGPILDDDAGALDDDAGVPGGGDVDDYQPLPPSVVECGCASTYASTRSPASAPLGWLAVVVVVASLRRRPSRGR